MPFKAMVLSIIVCCATSAAADGLPVYATVGALYSAVDGNASTDSIDTLNQVPPVDLSIDGLGFDDEDFGWSASLGYQFLHWFSLELGYLNLGTVKSDFFEGTLGRVPEPELESEAITLAAQFAYPLSEQLSATWHIGVADAEFKADGGPAFIGIVTPPNIVEMVEARYADPDDETGYFFGVGLSWRLTPHFDMEARYSRQDLKVLKYDTFGIRLIGRL